MARVLRFESLMVCSIVALVVVKAEYDAITGAELCEDGRMCYNHGRCHSNSNDGNFECVCQTGFNGTNCQYSVTCGDITLQNIILTPNPYRNTHDSVVTYTCISGHQFADVSVNEIDSLVQKMARCDDSGEWHPTLTDCLVKCPAIQTWRGYITDGPGRLAGTAVRYTCWGKYPWYSQHAGEYQYKFKGATVGKDIEYTSICADDGTWSPRIRECVEVDGCPTISSDAVFTMMIVATVINFINYT